MSGPFKRKTTTHTVVLEEPLLFESSRSGVRGMQLPKLPSSIQNPAKNLGKFQRKQAARLPEVSEPDVVRHFTRLSTWNYAIDLGIFPLGSCSMKYNPRLNEEIGRGPEMCVAHPYDPEGWTQAHYAIMYELQEDLKKVTGLPGISLQPCAGAHGELTGLMLIAAYHQEQGKKRNVILTTDSAHGTNPASAALAGFTTVQIQSGEDGVLHPEAVKAALNSDVAALMITNPNTLGIFEKHIPEIAQILHEAGALLYIDGANLNAVMGIARPGDYGADVIQMNLHKTFSTPHGGGGPGSGPIAVSEKLIPYLPIPSVEKKGNEYRLNYDNPKSIGRVKAFYGNFGMFIRAWCYIKAYGNDLRQVSEDAILNANYIRSSLKDVLHIPVNSPTLHEIVFNDKNSKDKGLDTNRIAKLMIDYGMHPPTVHFPLCVRGALMIEPTETESKVELDRLIGALREIVTEGSSGTLVPEHVFRTKIDETLAARTPKLKFENWK